jgi:hypothetical protein
VVSHYVFYDLKVPKRILPFSPRDAHHADTPTSGTDSRQNSVSIKILKKYSPKLLDIDGHCNDLHYELLFRFHFEFLCPDLSAVKGRMDHRLDALALLAMSGFTHLSSQQLLTDPFIGLAENQLYILLAADDVQLRSLRADH